MSNVALDTLFKIEYGTDLELNKIVQDNKGINFVSRNRNNNGVVAKVAPIPNVEPNPAGSISVALGSSSVLFAFVQDEFYYSGRDLAYMIPRQPMDKQTKLFYCMCLHINRYKYNYGRQANKTIGKIMVPSLEDIPMWVSKIEIKDLAYYREKHDNLSYMDLDLSKWKMFDVIKIFQHDRGVRLTKADQIKGKVPLITAGREEQGLTSYISNSEMKRYSNCLTVDMFCNCYYRNYEFCCDDNIIVLFNDKLNKFNGLFISTIINMDSFRYSYGRQYRLSDLFRQKCYLPADENGEPDYLFMENYIKRLHFSKRL